MKRHRPGVEELQPRLLLSTILPLATPAEAAVSVLQIRHAYGFDQAFPAGKYDAQAGKGETIAVVDAYDSGAAASDLAAFDRAYGLPAARLRIGAAAAPDPAHQWDYEEALDLEWAHAIAPQATLLYEPAASASAIDLLAAEQAALAVPGVVVASNSWGSPSFFGDAGLDGWFQPLAGHAPVAVLASSGDSGPAVRLWPSDRLLSVGGTTLEVSASGRYLGERLWSGSGPGALVTYDADPYTGFPTVVYGTWYQIGGTSDAAPQWAALLAIVDQERHARHLAPLGTAAAEALLRRLPARDYHGYPAQEGKGSPQAARIVAATETVVVRQSAGLTSAPTAQPPADLTLAPAFELAGAHKAPAKMKKAKAPAHAESSKAAPPLGNITVSPLSRS